jgi:hypothetical protein
MAGFQHIQKSIDGFKEFEAVVRHLIGHHRIIYIHSIDETLIYQIIQIFLYLMIAHIGGIHDFRLAGAVLTYTKHIGDYLDIGAPPPHPFRERPADYLIRSALIVQSYIHLGLLYWW